VLGSSLPHPKPKHDSPNTTEASTCQKYREDETKLPVRSKIMAFAELWLPILGAGICIAWAIGAWYGGNKNLSIWLIFGGLVCLLLLGTLQWQHAIRKGDEEKKVAGLDRPYLFVEPFEPAREQILRQNNMYQWSHSDSPWIEQLVQFANHGRGAAVIKSIKASAVIVVAAGPDQSTFVDLPEIHLPSSVIVRGDGDKSGTFTAGPRVIWKIPFTAEQYKDKMFKLQLAAYGHLWFVGVVEYTDVLSNKYSTSFCAKFRINGELEIGGGEGCNSRT
jgi:hypothetical protein